MQDYTSKNERAFNAYDKGHVIYVLDRSIQIGNYYSQIAGLQFAETTDLWEAYAKLDQLVTLLKKQAEADSRFARLNPVSDFYTIGKEITQLVKELRGASSSEKDIKALLVFLTGELDSLLATQHEEETTKHQQFESKLRAEERARQPQEAGAQVTKIEPVSIQIEDFEAAELEREQQAVERNKKQYEALYVEIGPELSEQEKAGLAQTIQDNKKGLGYETALDTLGKYSSTLKNLEFSKSQNDALVKQIQKIDPQLQEVQETTNQLYGNIRIGYAALSSATNTLQQAQQQSKSDGTPKLSQDILTYQAKIKKPATAAKGLHGIPTLPPLEEAPSSGTEKPLNERLNEERTRNTSLEGQLKLRKEALETIRDSHLVDAKQSKETFDQHTQEFGGLVKRADKATQSEFTGILQLVYQQGLEALKKVSATDHSKIEKVLTNNTALKQLQLPGQLSNEKSKEILNFLICLNDIMVACGQQNKTAAPTKEKGATDTSVTAKIQEAKDQASRIEQSFTKNWTLNFGFFKFTIERNKDKREHWSSINKSLLFSQQAHSTHESLKKANEQVVDAAPPTAVPRA